MMQDSEAINFTDRRIQACPFPAYARIKEKGGVYLDESTGYYIVTDYSLVKRIAGDNKMFLNQTSIIGARRGSWQDEVDSIMAERGVPLRDVLISADPPEHTFQRSLIDKVFSPARVAKITDYLKGIIDDHISAFIDDGVVDFNAAISIPVPTTVIADQLGVPKTLEDLINFKKWSDALTFWSEPNVSREDQLRYTHDICDLQQFILSMERKYRVEPSDCMLSDLVHADVDGRSLTIEELVSMVMILLVAGNETTTTALSNGMNRLLSVPGLQKRLREEPSRIPDFVEEVLRIDSPLQGLFRRTVVDQTLGDQDVPAGSILVLKWGGANHDPDKFARPDDFDLERSGKTQHVAFGFGPHFCIGNQLARRELKTVFERLLARTRDIRMARRQDQAVRNPHYITFGFRNLWIEFDKS